MSSQVIVFLIDWKESPVEERFVILKGLPFEIFLNKP